MNLLEAVQGNDWKIEHALFTTFPFDPGFFYRYVYPEVGSNDAQLPTVFVDDTVYANDIEAWDTRGMGDEYLLEPVRTPGVFHPKIILLGSPRSVYLTVSSANLTMAEYCDAIQLGTHRGLQQSWVTGEADGIDEANLEFAAVARSARDFFGALVETDWISGNDASGAVEATVETLDWLDDVPAPCTQATRFLHNIEESLNAQVADRVGDVDQIVLSAPYLSNPDGLEHVLAPFDPNQVNILAESGNTNRDLGTLSCTLSYPTTVRRLDHAMNRWVHAKFVAVRGTFGSAVLFGSPNATMAALSKSADDGNVEAALLRTSDDPARFDPLADASRGGPGLYNGADVGLRVSNPVTPAEIEMRRETYAEWGRDENGSDDHGIELRDARLSQPRDDGTSILTLQLSSQELAGRHSMKILPSTDEESLTVTGELGPEPVSVEVEIPDDQRTTWRSAVIRVRAPTEDIGSNPRHVTAETQRLRPEAQNFANSDGRQGVTALLDAFLLGGEDLAGKIIEDSLEFLGFNASEGLQPQTGQSTAGSGPEREAASDTYPERRFRALARESSRSVTPESIIRTLLSFYLEQAESILRDGAPTRETVVEFTETMETYWRVIEFLFVGAETGIIEDDGIVECCRESLGTVFRTQRIVDFARLLSGTLSTVDQASQPANAVETREESEEGPTATHLQDEIASEMFRMFWSHPVFLLELEAAADTSILGPQELLRSVARVLTHLSSDLDSYLTDPDVIDAQFGALQQFIETVLSQHDQMPLRATGRAANVVLYGLLVRGDELFEAFVEAESDAAIAACRFAQEGSDDLEVYGFSHLALLRATPPYSAYADQIAARAEMQADRE